MAFSSGLSVPTMSMHHPAGQRDVDKEGKQRERERGRVKPKLPKATWSLLPTESMGSWVGREWLPSFRFLLLAPPPAPHRRDEERRTSVLLKRLRDTGATSSWLGHKHTHQLLNQASWSLSRKFVQRVTQVSPSVWFI